MALPFAGAHAVREGGHAVEHLVHLFHDVDAVDNDRLPLRHAQGDVEDGPVLGDVDPLSSEHGVPPLREPALLGEPEQQTDRLVRDPVLRIVEIEAGAFRDEPLPTHGIAGEELAEVPLADRRVVPLERRPGGARPERCGRGVGRAHASPSLQARRAALCLSIRARTSFQAATKLAAASTCSLAARASTSTPASACCASVASAPPPSTGIGLPTWPWS